MGGWGRARGHGIIATDARPPSVSVRTVSAMGEDPFERFRAVVRGRVQGVNFRYYTQRTAAQLGLRGWVRNQSDGSVEVVAEGPRPKLDQLLAFLRQGPPSARVDEVKMDWAQAQLDATAFEIRW